MITIKIIFLFILCFFITAILNFNRTFYMIIFSSLIFFLVAGILILNGVEYFGLVMIIIYNGAIVVMFLFLVLTINMRNENSMSIFTFSSRFWKLLFLLLIVSLFVYFFLKMLIIDYSFVRKPPKLIYNLKEAFNLITSYWLSDEFEYSYNDWDYYLEFKSVLIDKMKLAESSNVIPTMPKFWNIQLSPFYRGSSGISSYSFFHSGLYFNEIDIFGYYIFYDNYFTIILLALLLFVSMVVSINIGSSK